MSIQILQYEFLGPIKLEEWGPPMEKVVYLILSRVKDTFNTLYVAECEKTDNNGFFTQNHAFKCWVDKSGSEKLLYLAILPMFDSNPSQRKQIVSKIITRYRPICNMEGISEEKPDYIVKPRSNSDIAQIKKSDLGKTLCPCCGSEMKSTKVTEKSSIIKCSECGLSDTRLDY